MQQSKKGRLLIIEDESIIAMDMQQNLEKAGYEVVNILSGTEDALNYLKSNSVDLVIADISLKDELNGADLGKDLWQLYDLPAIFITNHSEELIFRNALKSHPYGYIVKPFIDRDFIFTVEMAFDRLKMENNLKHRLSNYELLFDQIPYLVAVSDLNGKIISVNNRCAEGFNFDKDKLSNTSLFKLIQPKDKYRLKKYIIELVKESQVHFEMTVLDIKRKPIHLIGDAKLIKENDEARFVEIVSLPVALS